METPRDEFWQYLQTSGVEETLSDVLQKLYRLEKKPENAVEFLRNNLIPGMAQKLEAQTQEIASLKKELTALKKKSRR